jgi:hypothetical protein
MLVAMSLDELLRRQGGVLTLHQAVELGMSWQTVARRAGDGRGGDGCTRASTSSAGTG